LSREVHIIPLFHDFEQRSSYYSSFTMILSRQFHIISVLP